MIGTELIDLLPFKGKVVVERIRERTAVKDCRGLLSRNGVWNEAVDYSIERLDQPRREPVYRRISGAADRLREIAEAY
jgi:hypothetical protein